MKCPYCGTDCPEGALYCDVCKQPLPTKEDAAGHQHRRNRVKRTPLQRALFVLLLLVCFAAVGVGLYKVFFWLDSYKITRLYTRGAYTPSVNAVTMPDGQLGHALVFYGKDGDMVYLKELDQSLSICGGTARLTIADSSWFDGQEEDFEYADIRFAPILMRADGTEVQLPILNYTIDMPESPLSVISPAKNDLRVVTSSYPLQLQVVPGSAVFVNGEDITARIDRSGAFSGSVSVRPIGDNTYTVIVRTPNHRESRNDIVLFREQYDIEIELDSQVSTVSSENTMPIIGACEPGAMISVDTPFIEESMQIDMTTGKFSFIAKLEHLGDNIVRFRASMDGRKDAVISFTVNYKPTLAQYSAKAWRMDYEQLRLYFENWVERVFLCEGPIIDSFIEDDEQYLVMNVGKNGERQLVILKNASNTKSPTLGPIYSAYADVSGRFFYENQYYPLLITRYLDVKESK